MAIIQIPNLPAVIGLDGSELFEGVQAGTSVKISLNQMIAATRGGLPTTLPIPVSVGGTGLDTFTVGDIMYASATQTFSKLADVATGNAIISGGVGVAPSYGKIGLTTHVDGVLPVANGGTGVTTLTGYVKGSGTSPFTASPTIPNTDITGLGTMSTQNADAVAITGGTAALTGASSVTVNSSSTAFTVTQTGAGNAFLVEDSASDTTPFVIDASGNVGVGTGSPSGYGNTGRFAVQTASSTDGIVATFANSGSTGAAIQLFQTGISTATIGMPAGAAGITFAPSGTTERMRIDTSGNVMIGTTAALAKLVVAGDLSVLDAAQAGYQLKAISANGLSTITAYQAASQAIAFETTLSGTIGERMRIDASGNVGIGTSSPSFTAGSGLHVYRASGATIKIEDANTNADFLAFGGTLYLANRSNGPLTLSTNNVERMRIDASGNVGIGTSSPYDCLNVSSTSGAAPSNTANTNTIRLASTATNGVGVGPSILFEGQTGNSTPQYGFAAIQGFKGSATAADYSGGLAFFVQPNGGSTLLTERLRVASAGQIGIGGANYGTSGQTIISAGAAAAPAWGTLPLTGGGTGVTTAPAAAAVLLGYTSTATAAGTTVLTDTSTQYQLFTGTLAQTITLPVTSTLTTGWSFHIVNNSTGSLTVNSSGGNLVCTVIAGLSAMVTCIGTTLTTAADWEPGLTDFQSATGTGSVVLGTAPTITNALISASNAIRATGTLALAFATNTFVQVTPNATGTFTTTVPVVGTTCTLIVLTSGVTSFVMTFGTGFKTTGTLTTGTVSARYFVFRFVSDGTNLIEASRTIAIA